MNRFSKFSSLICIGVLAGCVSQPELPLNLVPSTPSKAPDYFCTWNLQGYVCSNSSNEDFRKAMNENYILGTGKYENWVGAFPEICMDLDFVMDDSWDVPLDQNGVKDNLYLGTTILDQTRFPSFTGTNAERLFKLVEAVKSKGWRGLGGWICAQEPSIATNIDSVAYWSERLKEANSAGFTYWKVDWGKQAHNGAWREMLSLLGKKYAPNLVIEHALNKDFITFSDVYRTYDVENVISQPTTIERVVDLLDQKANINARGLINCEDEPYIAVGLGCAIGVMRHQFQDSFPDGKTDFCFPMTGRNVKYRRDEVIRGVRWHRIAEPFGVDGVFEVDSLKLEDYWVFAARETWYYWGEGRQAGDTIRAQAPARASRHLPLPRYVATKSLSRPYLLSSLYPNGAIAIASISRSLNRSYSTECVEVEQDMPSGYNPVGVLGRFKKLTLIYPEPIDKSRVVILGQDLATNRATDITDKVVISGNRVELSQELIDEIGLQKVSDKDLSDPGLVLQIFKK